MTIQIEEECVINFDFNYQSIVTDTIQKAIEVLDFPFEAEVNVLFVTPNEIKKINKSYREIDKETDVLSFPMLTYKEAGNFENIEEDSSNFNLDTGEALLGDIIISVERLKEQAITYGHSEKRELAFLIVHSMLHLFGYDHITAEEAKTMETIQEKILNQLGILR